MEMHTLQTENRKTGGYSIIFEKGDSSIKGIPEKERVFKCKTYENCKKVQNSLYILYKF